MTVSTEVNQAAYTGNGVTTVFPYAFRILNSSNLTVTRINLLEVETVLTLGTDYTVTGAGTYNGGAITLPQPLPAGYSLVIERDLAAVQETDLRNQGTFFAEVHEDVFDYLTMLVQQVTSWLGLALRRPTIKSKFYDAKQFRIANLADPINAQDAVNNQTMNNALAALAVDGSGQFVLQVLADTTSATQGDYKIGVRQPFTGAVGETQHGHNAKKIDALSSGAKGDGTNDDAAFAILESQSTYSDIDLLGKTYGVTTLPTIHRYFNGYFKRLSDGYIFDASPDAQINSGNRNILIGGEAGKSMPKYVEYRAAPGAYNVIAIGYKALTNNISGRNTIAIGSGALQNMKAGRYNVAIGLESQYSVDSNDGAVTNGCRNTSVGDNSLRFNVNGYSNIAMGRNAGQVSTGEFNNILGAGAFAGHCPLDLDDQTIVNSTPSVAYGTSMLGTEAGLYLSGGFGQVLVGRSAGGNLKQGTRNIAMGWMSMAGVDSTCSYDGFTKTTVSVNGTYTVAAGVITISATVAGAVVGGRVMVKLGSHEANYYRITAMPDANTIKASTPYTGITESGIAVVTSVESVTSYGAQSQDNVSVGANSMITAVKTSNTVALGSFTCQFINGADNNAAAGTFALQNLVTGGNNSALGYGALRFMQGGTAATALTNCTGIGYNARVSGDNQIQIGDGATTTYVYGTVQNRSDIRDKDIDDESPKLGIEFIVGLNPVQGRWDMREDYLEEYQVQVGIDDQAQPVFETRMRQTEKDGSKRRNRLHQWFIAQEVSELLKSLGLNPDNIGLIQHHAVNGGDDVYSMGYDEFIPPAVRAIKSCWARIEEQDERIKKLEGVLNINQ